MVGWWDGGAPHVLVPVFRVTGPEGGADMCLARREGSEGLICPADTSMTTRSSSWGGQRSGTCLGCTPCELAPPPPRSRSRGPARVAPEPWPDPQTPQVWLFREPPSGHCVHGSPGPPRVCGAQAAPSCASPASPQRPALGPRPSRLGASPGLLWVGQRSPGRASVPWGPYGPWAGVHGVEGPSSDPWGDPLPSSREPPIARTPPEARRPLL